MWPRRLPILLAALLVLVVASAAGVSHLEENDRFCISCHLAPEVTYHERATAASAVAPTDALPDLASFHYWNAAQASEAPFRCIDCHRGDDSLTHRGRVLLLAAGDTVTYLTGQADASLEKGAVAAVNPNREPWQGPERFNRAPDILDAGCLKCHHDALTLVGFDNHFHNKLPAALLAYEETGELHYPANWPGGVGAEDLLQPDETALTCLDCHRAHVQGFHFEYFLDEINVVLPACVQCHVETDRGPVDLVR